MDSLGPIINSLSDSIEGDKLLRSVLILVCGMLLFNLPTLLYKVRLFIRGILYFFFCWDKSFKKPTDPGSIFAQLQAQGKPIERKTIYFVRHGESTWNETFNKGKHRSAAVFLIGFVPGLIKALLYELYLLLSGKLDSWFYDAPLSHLGLSQAEDLSKFLKERPNARVPESSHISILRADPGAAKSKILCSSLRRAVSTIACGFKDRFARRPLDKILIIPALQEVSRNPDTLSITPAHMHIQASWIEKSSTLCDFQDIFSSHTDMSLHTGNKPINTNGLIRMLEFCDFVYSGSVQEDYVIVGGHSFWFRYFFQVFLPYSVQHPAKTKKIVNGGVVAFDLMKADSKRGPKFMIDPKSIKVIYGGF